ncbi:hypothetical protein DL89DRAFT_64763 [Linderina pennispora]|uniref:Uncharacterized protein n=1 Tax=Linderina pennispora TaxID=61395 RepID=A0A1Y1VZV9_9FUNG|nr:uncharacterized protein DL89DRAFT_64763 [Linderina pennispora]ORX66546.1 hypothetical protein DL89DRAFT_64763 [Linderina pennispora]
MEEECSEATTARSVSAGSSKSLESSISRASGVSKSSDGSVGRLAKPVVSAESPGRVAGEQNVSLLWSALARLTIRRVKAESAVERLRGIEAEQARREPGEGTVKERGNLCSNGGESAEDTSTGQIAEAAPQNQQTGRLAIDDPGVPSSPRSYWGLGWWSAPTTAATTATAPAPESEAAEAAEAAVADNSETAECEPRRESSDQQQFADISEPEPVTSQSHPADPEPPLLPDEDSLPSPEQHNSGSSWWWPLLGSRSADPQALAASEVLPAGVDNTSTEQASSDVIIRY